MVKLQEVQLLKLIAALEGEPHDGDRWIAYATALLEGDLAIEARAVLRQAVGLGLQGDVVVALDARISRQIGPLRRDPDARWMPRLQRGGAVESVDNWSRALDLHRAGLFPEAAASYRRAIIDRPHAPEAHYNLGSVLQSSDKISDAVAAYREAIKLAPDFAEALNSLGTALRASGDEVAALDCFRRAIAARPDLTAAHHNLGNALYALSDFAAAAACFERALALRPDLHLTRTNLGHCRLQLGEYTNAVGCYRHSLAEQPEQEEAWCGLGTCLREVGEEDEALACFDAALKCQPVLLSALEQSAMLLLKHGRAGEARDRLLRVVALVPESPAYRYWLGEALRATGDDAGAAESYRVALGLPGSSVVAWVADALLSLGYVDESLIGYERALAIDPANNEVRIKFLRALLFAGQPDAALAQARAMSAEVVAVDRLPAEKATQVTALMSLGRSGSMFFHSLFDGHTSIATLPGVYFCSWFGQSTKALFRPDTSDAAWREKMVRALVDAYEPLFNARSRRNVPGKPLGNSPHLAAELGFTDMGPERNQTFLVDSAAFSSALIDFLQPCQNIDARGLFELIHRAFTLSQRRGDHECDIFYHIHNPKPDELGAFLHAYPTARLLYIVRNPVQNLESWLVGCMGGLDTLPANPAKRRAGVLNIWEGALNRIHSMLMGIQSPFHALADCRGVRLEDVKRRPRGTMRAVAAWMGIDEQEAFYDSSFCGLRYWGPASLATGKINGFDTRAIDRPVGMLFSGNDAEIFFALLWPLARDFSYHDESAADLSRRLDRIRPWLDEPFQFEIMIHRHLPEPRPDLRTLAPYNELHCFLKNCWSLLRRDGRYPFAIQPILPLDAG